MPEPEKVIEPNMIDSNELVVAIKRSPEGLMILLKPRTRGELIMAYGELQLAITQAVLKFDRSPIETPHKGIIDFARNIGRKK